MKILIISQYFWPEEFRINDVATALQEADHEVTVLTGIPNYPKGQFFKGYSFFGPWAECFGGVKILRVPLFPRGDGGGARLALNYLSFVFWGCILAPFRVRGTFDVILVYQLSPVTVGLPAIFLKWIKKAPIVFWVQDLWPESLSATGAIRFSMVLAVVGKLVRYIYSRCTLILVQSMAFIGPVLKMGVPGKKIQYMPNATETLYKPLSLPVDAPERESLPSGFKIMFAGNIGVAQDFETIISAAEALRGETDVKFVILGEGRARSCAERRVNKLGLSENVIFLGRWPAEAMPGFFSLADALLVTLKKEPIFSFTIPSKVQSYMACAKPIIAALDGEGARVIKESGAGFVVPAGNSAELADAILRLKVLSPIMRAEMGAFGLKYYEANFERGRLIRKLEETLVRVVYEKND